MTAPPLDAHPLAGQTAWIISDGKAGHEAQCFGVVEALGLKAEVKRVAPSGVFKWMAPWGPVAPRERFGQPGAQFAPRGRSSRLRRAARRFLISARFAGWQALRRTQSFSWTREQDRRAPT